MKKNILAIGSAAKKICNPLKKYDIYNVYEISNCLTRSLKKSFKLEERENAEEYEKTFNPDSVPFLKKIKTRVQIFLCGASQTSGICLKLMKYLKDRGVLIDVVYFVPELDFLSESQTLQERLCRGILQQYARSGALEEIMLISNKEIENILEKPSVFEYYETINKAFSESFYMMDIFKRSEPVLSTFSKRAPKSRIKSIGVSDLLCEGALFFPLKNEEEVYYYFGINEDSLKSDEEFFSKLREKLKSKRSDSKKVYFGIYSTKYEHDYVYVESFSSKIQEFPLDTE